ncbi:MAG: SLC13 family permease [Acidobacteria bacterium]|nr:MAG: SLC13 family permease [Acidobacteriota bacterium]
MTPDIAFVLVVVGVAFVLFWTEILPVEIVGLLALLALAMRGILGPTEAFRGFGSPALIMIASVLVLSASLVRNGAGERIADRIRRLSGRGRSRMVASLFAAAMGISAFINNVAATAMFIPVAESLAETYRMRSSRLLMPIAYASLLGGVCTLTGTSTNVAVAGALQEHGLAPLGIFELTPIGLPLAVIGLGYMLLTYRWLPGRARSTEQPGDVENDRRMYMTELEVPEDSPAVGRTVRELALPQRARLHPIGLIRGAVRLEEGGLDAPLRPKDVVVVEGDAKAINRGVAIAGLRRKTTRKLTTATGPDVALVEATVSYNSPLIGRTLREVDIRGRYGIDVVAIWRRGGPIVEKVGDVRLRLGDDLLIQGPPARIRRLAGDPLYLLLQGRELPRYDPRNELLSILVFALALTFGATGILPIAEAFLAGAVAVVLTGCLTIEEAYRSLNLKLVILIGSMIGVSLALEKTGAAEYVAQNIIGLVGGSQAPPLLVLAAIYWMVVVLTQSMTNAAAALLVLPVALSAAAGLDVSPRPFAVTVAVGASLAFMTPFEPACLLVMSAGRYRFLDFVRFGFPLTVLAFIAILTLVPRVFPF